MESTTSAPAMHGPRALIQELMNHMEDDNIKRSLQALGVAPQGNSSNELRSTVMMIMDQLQSQNSIPEVPGTQSDVNIQSEAAAKRIDSRTGRKGWWSQSEGLPSDRDNEHVTKRQRLAGPNAGDNVSLGGDTRSSENISSGESRVKSSDTSRSTKSNGSRPRLAVNNVKLSRRDKDTL